MEGPDVFDVVITADDGNGGTATVDFDVDVINVAPTIASIAGPLEPLAVGTPTAVTVSYADPGVHDSHDCLFSWGDGASETTVAGSGFGQGQCTGKFTYQTPGVYRVDVAVFDDDGGAAASAFEFVVVYDPNGGFVTGGGWIDSPAGAYRADPNLTGKASFGFVSKYKKGATTPTGQTHFRFQMAGFELRSVSYGWLVVAGARAQYKGTATVNGASGYGFLLTATDGQAPGGGGVDKFRIKVWETDTDMVVYDNVPDGSDDLDGANPQAIGGGSIVVHP